MLLVVVKDLLAKPKLIVTACHSILCFMWKYKNTDVQIKLNFRLREKPRTFFFLVDLSVSVTLMAWGLHFVKYFGNTKLSCFLKTKQENPNASYRDTPPTFFELHCLLKRSCCVRVIKIVS